MLKTTRGRIDGWEIYLALIVCLIPVVVPSGPARMAIVDAVIVLGFGAFAAAFLTRKQPVRVPFMTPVLIITVGSLVAVVNAESVSAAFLALAQDAYLFAWFVMLVHLLSERDLVGVQRTWVWVANIIALIGIVLLITQGHVALLDIIKPTGKRAYGTFYNPNMFASYLVMSIFIVLGLRRQLGRLLRWGSIALLTVALMATKSNGGMLSLLLGLMVWLAVRAWTRRIPVAAVAAGSLIVVALGLGAVWMYAGLGVGSAQMSAFQSKSFLARAGHSSAGRFTIWKNLQDTYARSPLGIGPGNSRYQTLSIEDRLRPNSLQAKEAHNDYVAYAIERGPLGLLGLMALLGSAFGRLASAAKRRDDADGSSDTLGPMAAASAGALLAASIHALTTEVLHFRHFWMLMAIICAIEARAARHKADAHRPAQPAGTLSRPGVAAA